MKKLRVILLCFVLCISFVPVISSAEGTIQYAALTATDTENLTDAAIVTEGVTNADQAASVANCVGVIIYSLDAGVSPAELSGPVDAGNKNLILSNVALSGSAGYRGLFLLGSASLNSAGTNCIISGSSTDGSVKPALSSESMANGTAFLSELEGAKLKYTITSDMTVSEQWVVHDLIVNSGVTMNISASGGEQINGIYVEHSLTVNGSLTADEGQVLEIRQGCTNVSGVTLYQNDGANEFTDYGTMHESFTYDGGKWVQFMGGGGDGGGAVQHTIDFSWESGRGRILVNNVPENSVHINEGENVQCVFEPERGYTINDVIVDTVSVGAAASYEFQNVTTGHSLYVDFQPVTYTIQASTDGNGSISPDGNISVTYDSNQSFSVIPNNGYRLSDIIVDDRAEGPINPYEFHHIEENHTIRAVFEPVGDGTINTITAVAAGNGTISADGMTDGTVQVQNGFDQSFTLTPAAGWRISEITVNDGMDTQDFFRDVVYNGDGTFLMNIREVLCDMTLTVTFAAESEESFNEITDRGYAVHQAEAGSAVELKAALAREIGYLGYSIPAGNIVVSDIDTSGIESAGYGTFLFTVTVGGIISNPATGYILPQFTNILFKYTGTHEGQAVNEIRIANEQDEMNGEFSVPAMDSGVLEIIGVNYGGMEGLHSMDVGGALSFINRNKILVNEAFYRVQLHIANRDDNNPETESDLNWFTFTLIQDDAYCVEVSASDGENEQRTFHWDLNRYAQLTTGSYTSQVYFGNDIFTISLPASGIGGVESFSTITGEYTGYTVSDNGDGTYSVHFLSDFYDRVTLDMTINGTEQRQLVIHRVGVFTDQYYAPHPDVVFHGTQYGTAIDYSNGMNYRIYSTYYIPDFGTTAPYGLYVIYKWANGTTTTQIITEAVTDGNMGTPGDFDGVFRYENGYASCCDYLLYSAADGTNAPESIWVTVLKNNPAAGGVFGGIYFGSGTGVQWLNEN